MNVLGGLKWPAFSYVHKFEHKSLGKSPISENWGRRQELVHCAFRGRSGKGGGHANPADCLSTGFRGGVDDKIRGDQITFTAAGTQYTGRVNGNTMTINSGGSWNATRAGR